MPPMRAAPPRPRLACLLVAAALARRLRQRLGLDNLQLGRSGTAESRPAPPKSDFPSAEGKTLPKC